MINSYSMFTWPTYELAFIRIFFRIYSILSIGTLAFVKFFTVRRVLLSMIIFYMLLFITEMYILILDMSFSADILSTLPRMIRLLVSVGVLLLLNQNEIKLVFQCFTKVFVLVCIPSVIYFMLGDIADKLPHNILYSSQSLKSLLNVYYKHYPLGLIMATKGGLMRICGVFDEPGFMGTMLAFIYASTRKHNSTIWNVMILVSGIFTLSLAFTLLILAYHFIETFYQNNLKSNIRLIVIYLGAVAVFILFILNFRTSNPHVLFMQHRFLSSDGQILRNNRFTPGFDNAFKIFFQNGGISLWIGNGSGAASTNIAMQGSSNYKCLIYDYGIVGGLLYFACLACLVFFLRPQKQAIPFIVIFFLSIYQRPYVLDFLNIAFLYCSIKYINYVEG